MPPGLSGARGIPSQGIRGQDMNPEEIFDDYQQQEAGLLTRRGLLRGAALGAAMVVPAQARASISALMCPPEAGSFGGNANGYKPGGSGLVGGDEDYSGEVPDDGPGMRHLKMTNWRTGEVFDRPYVENGQYVDEAIDEFSQFARDWRQNEVKPFDPKSIDIVWKIWRKLGISQPFNLNSGYRSPVTNASLPGTAKQSYHMRAKACDISTSSATVRQIHAAAVSLKAGGVGKYTSSGFVHIDSGPVRYWGS